LDILLISEPEPKNPRFFSDVNFFIFLVTPTSTKTQQPQNSSPSESSTSAPFDVLLRCLSNGMLRGGVGGFLKNAKTATGIRATIGQRETRIGISQVCFFSFKNIAYLCR